MCNKGYKVILHGTRYEIRKEASTKGTRTNDNVHYVKDNNRGNCLLAQVYNQIKDIAMDMDTGTTIIKMNTSQDKSLAKMVEE